jgi:hypothetical protein
MHSSQNFLTPYYQRHNQRRQEHLASLGLPISCKTVLEVGSGIGDHTSYFIDRNCKVTSTDGRQELLDILLERHPQATTFLWDLELPPPDYIPKSQIVYAYGILYHTSNPLFVLENLSLLCTEMLLLETCVSFGDEELINLTSETIDDSTQALQGKGCRPTRQWIFKALKNLFPYVYLTKTQPWHEEFPVEWANLAKSDREGLTRSVFVASKMPLYNPNLSSELLNHQER